MLNFTRRIRDLIYYSVPTEKSAAILRGFVNPAQKKLEKETSIYLLVAAYLSFTCLVISHMQLPNKPNSEAIHHYKLARHL